MERVLIHSAERRLKEEMGITAQLKKIGKFHYVSAVGNGLTENEIDHVFIGMHDNDEILFNKDEVEDYCWEKVIDLEKKIKKKPEIYTPWLRQALEIASNHLSLGLENGNGKLS